MLCVSTPIYCVDVCDIFNGISTIKRTIRWNCFEGEHNDIRCQSFVLIWFLLAWLLFCCAYSKFYIFFRPKYTYSILIMISRLCKLVICGNNFFKQNMQIFFCLLIICTVFWLFSDSKELKSPHQLKSP